MRLTADENVPRVLIFWLREIGCDVHCIREMSAGASDTDIMMAAASEQRVILTFDKDFGEL